MSHTSSSRSDLQGDAGEMPDTGSRSNAGDMLDTGSYGLAALLRPGSPTRQRGTEEVSVSEAIWDKVVRDGARLAGVWTETIDGALEAARAEDWTLCAYLAARCYINAGGASDGVKALQEIDEGAHRRIWSEVVVPVVVDVPPGAERLKVCVGASGAGGEWIPTDQIDFGSPISSDGYLRVKGRGRGMLVGGGKNSEDFAEKFKVGAQVNCTRLKRLIVDAKEIDNLRILFQINDSEGISELLKRQTRTMQMTCGWYQVMAYPFGSFDKALVRRVGVTGWTTAQLQTIWKLGETLMSQCARASQWDLVKTLVTTAKVPCPDISHEFESVFPKIDSLRRLWRKDLHHSFGGGRVPSILEMAAWDKNNGTAALQFIIESLPPQRQRTVLGSASSKKQQPLIVFAALKGQWHVIEKLLNLKEDIPVYASQLQNAEYASLVPAHLQERLKDRVRKETNMPVRAVSLREYFHRQLQGEFATVEMAPKGFEFKRKSNVIDNGYMSNVIDNGYMRVINRSLWLGNKNGRTSDWEVVFVRINEREYEEILAILEDEDNPADILPFKLNTCSATLQEPEDEDWLVVCCPRSYFKEGNDGEDPVFEIPPNCIPSPFVGPLGTVEVQVVTPCCREPLPGVPVHINKKYVGETPDGDSRLRVHLPPGQYVIGGLELTDKKDQPLRVEANTVQTLTLATKGNVYVYLMDIGTEEERRDGVYVSTDLPSKMADDATNFCGYVKYGGRRHACSSCEAAVCYIKAQSKCAGTLATLGVENFDGREFQPEEEYVTRCRTADSDECLLKTLMKTPLKLGVLTGVSNMGLAGALRPPRACQRAPARGKTGSRGAARCPPRPQSAAGGRSSRSIETVSSVSAASMRRPASADRNRRRVHAARRLDSSLLQIWRSL